MSAANERDDAVRDIVLLRGWGMTSAAWRELAAQWPASYRVHALDFADGDGSDMRGDALSAFAESVAARAPARCNVVGWSLGAQVALRWALRRPAQVHRLAVIAATPCFVAREGWASAMPPAVFEAFADLVRTDPNAALARFTLLQAQGDEHMSRVARALRGAVQKTASHAAHVLRDELDVLRRTDLRAGLTQVAQRVCVLHGERDGLVPLSAAEYLHHALPHARLHVMSGAAHAPHVSQPEKVAALITDCFDER